MQGVRDMVINTQKTNIHKISSILESNMTKVSLEVDVHNSSYFNAACYLLILTSTRYRYNLVNRFELIRRSN